MCEVRPPASTVSRPPLNSIGWLVVAACALHLCVAVLGPAEYGWWMGTYHFAHLSVCVLALAVLLAHRSGCDGALHFLSRVLLVAFAIPVLVCTVFGGVGLLKLSWVSAAVDLGLGVWVAAMGTGRFGPLPDAFRLQRRRSAAAGWLMGLCAVVAVIFICRAWGAQYWRLPPRHWDDHIYHLSFPAHWLHAHRLQTLVPPRGDPSCAFYALNAQIIYFWAMLPFGKTDYAVRLAPIIVLLATVIHLMSAAASLRARRLGLAVVPLLVATFPFLNGPFRRMPGIFHSGALGSDHMLSMFAAAAVAMLLRWIQRCRLSDAVCFGAALGLMAGTKFHGAAYALLLLAPFIWSACAHALRTSPRSGPVRRAGLGVVLCLFFAFLLGGFCYTRNLVNTGNPVYPAEVRIFGRVIFPGPRSTEVYQTHPFHADKELNTGAVRRYLGPLWEAMAVLCIVGCVLVVLRSPWTVGIPRCVTLLLPFLIFGAMVAISPFRWIRFGYAGIILLPLGPAVVAGAVEGRLRGGRRLPDAVGRLLAECGRALALVIPVCALAGAGAAIAALPRVIPWYQVRKAAWYEHVCLRQFKVMFAEGWRAVDDLTRGRGARIGYWSMDVSYPLFGRRLQNRVFFIPRNRWTFASVYDFGSTVRDVSGEGNDIVIGGLTKDDLPNANLWARNLKILKVDYLFLGPDLKTKNYPVEYAWANALVKTGRLEVVHKGENHVIYRVLRALLPAGAAFTGAPRRRAQTRESLRPRAIGGASPRGGWWRGSCCRTFAPSAFARAP